MSENETQIVKHAPMNLSEITARVNLVHDVLHKVMQKGTHYGTVPHCGDRMVLLKPGADLLAMTFRLVPQFQIDRRDVGGGHYECSVTCSMYSATGELLGQGVGSASTLEKKYRYRWEGEGRDRRQVENPDIADVYNTVLKIAKKRAHIDATLTVTGAADLFTQDLIDIDEDTPIRQPIKATTERKAERTVTPVDGESLAVVVTFPDGCKQKSGSKKNGQGWTSTFGKADDGEYYSTFDPALGADLMSLKPGDQVRVEYTTEDGPKGPRRTVKAIEPVTAHADPEPTEPEPKQGKSDNIPF